MRRTHGNRLHWNRSIISKLFRDTDHDPDRDPDRDRDHDRHRDRDTERNRDRSINPSRCAGLMGTDSIGTGR